MTSLRIADRQSSPPHATRGFESRSEQRKFSYITRVYENFLWLGLSDLFQTFEDLESVIDKEAEIANIRELLDESDSPQNDEKEPLC